MMIGHPEISAPTATLATIVTVLDGICEGKNYGMCYRCTFVDHFRYFPTEEPNGLGGVVWCCHRGRDFNTNRVNEFLDSHPNISKWDFLNFLDAEADRVDEFFNECWGGDIHNFER